MSSNVVEHILAMEKLVSYDIREIVSYGLWPWRDGKVDISKLVRGGFQLLTRSHKSYSLTSSPLITKVSPIRPVHAPQASRLFLCNKTGGEGSRSSLLYSAPYSTAILAQVRTRASLQLVRYRPLQLTLPGAISD